MRCNMSELSEILTNDAIEIELKGKKYKLGALTLQDLAESEKNIRDKHKSESLTTAKELYGDKIPTDILKTLMKPLSSNELLEMQQTISGMCFLVWRAFLKFNPSMTLEEVEELVSFEDLSSITNILMPPNEDGEKKTTE